MPTMAAEKAIITVPSNTVYSLVMAPRRSVRRRFSKRGQLMVKYHCNWRAPCLEVNCRRIAAEPPSWRCGLLEVCNPRMRNLCKPGVGGRAGQEPRQPSRMSILAFGSDSTTVQVAGQKVMVVGFWLLS